MPNQTRLIFSQDSLQRDYSCPSENAPETTLVPVQAHPSAQVSHMSRLSKNIPEKEVFWFMDFA